MTRVRPLLRDSGGASAAEFALVLPLLILLLLGIIDAGRFMWEFNQAEKATQMGARMAVVTNPVAPGLAAGNFVGQSGLADGDFIPASAFGVLECTSTTCTCKTAPCPFGAGPTVTAAFNPIVARMKAMKGDIAAANVVITYRGSGLGYAGAPGMDISPLISVSLRGLTFRPIYLAGLVNFAMPDFATTLTAEDSAGTASN